MQLTGFFDEAAPDLDGQLRAVAALGWTSIECRNIDGINLTNLDDSAFDGVCQKLQDANVGICCFGSAIANWATPLSAAPESSYAQLHRAILRMHRLGTTLIRVMSFSVPEDGSVNDPQVTAEVIQRMRHLTRIAEDGGVTLVHENCDTWGGRSHEHTLRLIDAIASPNFKLALDTGNPVFRKDICGEKPFRYQDAWGFYQNVKDHISHVHIKDGRIVNGAMEYSYPGEGDGSVRRICADLKKSGYSGYISIEPHLSVVAHDSMKVPAEAMFDTFVEYGHRMEKLLADC